MQPALLCQARHTGLNLFPRPDLYPLKGRDVFFKFAQILCTVEKRCNPRTPRAHKAAFTWNVQTKPANLNLLQALFLLSCLTILEDMLVFSEDRDGQYQKKVILLIQSPKLCKFKFNFQRFSSYDPHKLSEVRHYNQENLVPVSHWESYGACLGINFLIYKIKLTFLFCRFVVQIKLDDM